jgi:hypothetical protein
MAFSPDVTVITPPARETARARFRVLVAAESERIGRQMDEACEQVRTRAEQQEREIRERAAAEVAELHRLAEAAEAAADGLVGRDPYANAPAWAADKRLDQGVERLAGAVESHRKTDSDEDEGES